MSPSRFNVPRGSQALLRRHRLVELVQRGLDAGVLLVTAPAGYGKTSLLIDYSYRCTSPLCWLSLTEDDREAMAFLHGLRESLSVRLPDLGEHIRQLLNYSGAITPRPADILASLLDNVQTNAKVPIVLVLDDYHFVDESPTGEIVQHLLNRLPANLQLALLSRVKPHLTFGLVAAHRRLADISRDDLRFRTDETQELLATIYSFDAASRAEELTERMEGWITGVVLAAETRAHAPSLPRAASEEEQDWVYQYLAAELFDHLPDYLKTCLLAASLFDDLFDTDLLRPLLAPHSPEQCLAEAERRNLFLTRLSDGGYRLHQRFRDFLRSLHTDQQQEAAWQCAAASIFFERGDKRAAVKYFLRASALEQAASCLETIGDAAFLDSHAQEMAGVLDALGPVVLRQHPRLLLLRARAALNAADQPLAQSLVDEVLQTAMEGTLVATAHIVQAEVQRLADTYQAAIKSCREALELLPPDDRALRAYALRILAAALFDSEQLAEAFTRIEEAAALYEQLGDLSGLAYLENMKSCALSDLGRQDDAVSGYRRAISMWRDVGNGGREALSLANLGWEYYCAGRLDEALNVLTGALELGRRSFALFTMVTAHTNLGDVYRDRGDFASAFEHYAQSLSLSQGFARRDVLFTKASIGLAHIRLGDLEAAARELDPLPHRAEDHPTAVVCRAYGMLLYLKGHHQEADDVLADAIPLLSAPERPLAYFQRGLAARALGDPARSDEHFGQAVDVIRRTGYVESLPAQAAPHLDTLRQFASTADASSPIHELIALIYRSPALPEGGSDVGAPRGRPQTIEVRLLSSSPVTMVDGRQVAAWAGALHLLAYLLHRSETTALQAAADLWEADTSGETEADVVRSLVNHFQVMKYRLKKILGDAAIVQIGPRPLRYRLHPEICVTYDVRDFLSAGDALLLAPGQESQVEHIERLLREHPGSFALAGDFAGPTNGRPSWVQETAYEVESLRARLLNRQLSLLPAGDVAHRQVQRAIADIAERTGIGLPELV